MKDYIEISDEIGKSVYSGIRKSVVVTCESCGGNGYTSVTHYSGDYDTTYTGCDCCGGSGYTFNSMKGIRKGSGRIKITYTPSRCPSCSKFHEPWSDFDHFIWNRKNLKFGEPSPQRPCTVGTQVDVHKEAY
jgi:hypothetical protein